MSANNLRSDLYQQLPASSFYAVTSAKRRRVPTANKTSSAMLSPPYSPRKSSPSRHYSFSRNSFHKVSRHHERNSPNKHHNGKQYLNVKSASKYERVFGTPNGRKRQYDSRENAYSMPSYGSNHKSNGDKSPRQNFRVNLGRNNSRSPEHNHSPNYRSNQGRFYSPKTSPYRSHDNFSNSSSSNYTRKSWPALNFNKSYESYDAKLSKSYDTPKKKDYDSVSEKSDLFHAPHSPTKYRRPVTLSQVQSDEENKENTEHRESKDIRKDLFRPITSSSETSFPRNVSESQQQQQPQQQLQLPSSSQQQQLPSTSQSSSTETIYQTVRYKRDPLEPLPLPNIGNSCYMNSVLQTLFNCPMLMNEIETASRQIMSTSNEDANDKENETSIPITNSLITLFQMYHQYRSMDQTTEGDMQNPLSKFKQDVSQVDPSFRYNYQQDAVEFLDVVLNSIDDEFIKVQKELKGKLSFSNPISKVMKMGLSTITECVECHDRSQSDMFEQHSLILGLPDENALASRNEWSLQHFVNDYFKAERNEADCNKCPCKEKFRRYEVKKKPKALVLQLVRHSRDEQKRHERIIIPETIGFPSFALSKSVFSDSDSSNNYQLISVICHHGSSLRSGHYNSFNYDTKHRQWYKCDDTSISKISFQNVQEDSQSSGYCFVYIDKSHISHS